ncbi:MAG: glycosyltransferase family 2 protein [Cyclobacteriaceae bacterium]
MDENLAAPKVIVLILSYDGKYLLEDALSSYLNNDYPNYEVVVIDNGSSDGTEAYVKETFPAATVIRLDQNQGYSGGFNFGLDYAFNQQKADYVLITNNDVKADSHIISGLVETAMTDKKIGYVTGKAYYFDQPDTLQSVGKYEDPVKWNGEHIGSREVDRGQHDEVAERCFIDDIFMLVSKELYQTTGGYDTNFFFQAEEYDWQARGKAAGFRIMYTPHAKLWHKESMTIGKKSASKAYYDARNPMLVILKHRSPEYFKRYFWNQFPKTIKGFLVSCKQRRFDVAFRKISGLISGLRWGIRQREFSRRHFI